MGNRVRFRQDFSVPQYRRTELEKALEVRLAELGISLGMPEVRGNAVGRGQEPLAPEGDLGIFYLRQLNARGYRDFETVPNLQSFLRVLEQGRFDEEIIVEPGLVRYVYMPNESGHCG